MSEASTPDGRGVAAASGVTAPPDRRRWLILGVIALAQLMIVLDATIMNIALPSAQQDLGFSIADRQWVVTAYALAFGSLLLLGGKLADLLGRKAIFLAGLIGFAVASAVGGAAVSFGMLVAARASQGVFAALLAPTALSLLSTIFTDPTDRPRAFGVYGAVAGAGGAVGLLLGGLLTEYLSWRWCLYVNLVFAGVAAAGALVLLGPQRATGRPRLDVPRGRAGVRRHVLHCLWLLQRRHPPLGHPIHLGVPGRRGGPFGRLRPVAGPCAGTAAAAAERGRPQPRWRLPVDAGRRCRHVRGCCCSSTSTCSRAWAIRRWSPAWRSCRWSRPS
jgi:MFS family permease